MHDDTLTDDNREKLIQLVERYNQIVKFYNVDELCTEEIAKIQEFFPNVGVDRHSIATFYRFFIPHLLPQETEKILYLDADIIVNLDIAEFWQIELGDKPFGAVPEVCQLNDRDVALKIKKSTITICGAGVVNPEDYFNAGVMLMNLKVLREEEDTILAGMKFISENPQFTFLDQDILNYCFSTTYLKLPTKFNRFVLYAKRENEWTIQEKIYHFAAGRICFVMDSRDSFNQLFMSYFLKTPWVDAETKAILSGDFTSRKNYPVTVIIPLYNMEEYVGECLDSLLAQTFQAFEVIVVDDCSTDNSCAIVESYAPKFNGRLKLAHTERNSGGGGYVPRNIGLKLAGGEYVYILDSDDMILGTALETFYSAAILYNTDIVYTRTCYFLNAPNDISLYKDVMSRKLPELNTELTIDNPSKNLNRLLSENGMGEFNTIQTTFCRRNFLLDNGLFFPQIARSGDFLWIVNVYCHARRFLRISTPLCFRRKYNDNSITRKVRELQEQCSFWLAGFIEFAESFYELKKENGILSENPTYDLTILKKNLLWSLDRTDYARKKLDSAELFKVLHNEFAKNFSDSTALLLPFFFSFIDGEIKINEYYSEIFKKFNRYFTARIDIKFMSTEGDFQIVSVSDNRAEVKKPAWLQKDGIGYQIQSCTGSMEIIVKAAVDAQILLNLKGIDVRNPKDKSKRISYWIDYTKLIVNGKMIFNRLKPVWHDKSYNYAFDAKAGEKIKIQTEWQPHGSEVAKIALPPPPPPEKVEPPVVDKFLPYLTARLDAKLTTAKGGDFKIVSISDGNAAVKKPVWFQKGGVGYVIQSLAGKMKLVAKATSDGQLNLKLRSLWVPDPNDKSKLIPYWIDYTKLTINGKSIFDKATPAWHDEPFNYNLNVKADEEITLEVEWLPHKSEVPKVAPPPPPPEKVVEPIVDKFLPYLTARLDAKLTTAKGGDFKILSVSDDKAAVKKPAWFQKGGVGYVIQSLAGEMKLVAKATADGQLNLKLRSLWVPDPDDKSKLIPYWIDYTKLIVNGKAIFDKATPAWHDEPFIYNLNVKADEEITLDVEWLPHMGEVPKIAPPPEKVEPPVVDKFLPYLTARLDAKLTTAKGGDFKIVSISDDKAAVKKPAPLQKGGVGYVIQSLAGNMKLVAKATADGQLNLKLRGLWVPDPNDKSKLIPYWIDYTKLTINGETIFDKPTPAWHDEPFIYNLNVKAGEEITLQVEWLPHMGEVPKIAPPPQVEPPVSKLSAQQRTARLDAKLFTEEGGDFQILSISDDKADVKKPAWLQKGGVGYVIQSLAGKMKLVAKATSNGQLSLKLRGLWVPDPNDKSKLIPYWIDFTKLIVNDKSIFNKTTPAWHDEPYIYILDVKAGDEITLETTWLPHKSGT